jgi:hypothetical protein
LTPSRSRAPPAAWRTKERLHAAAARAKLAYPGPVGELLSQELPSWMAFGHQLGQHPIMRVTNDLLIEEAPNE